MVAQFAEGFLVGGAAAVACALAFILFALMGWIDSGSH